MMLYFFNKFLISLLNILLKGTIFGIRVRVFDDVGYDFYIDGMDEADEAAHGYGSNTPSDEAYGYMSTEERPNQD